MRNGQGPRPRVTFERRTLKESLGPPPPPGTSDAGRPNTTKVYLSITHSQVARVQSWGSERCSPGRHASRCNWEPPGYKPRQGKAKPVRKGPDLPQRRLPTDSSSVSVARRPMECFPSPAEASGSLSKTHRPHLADDFVCKRCGAGKFFAGRDFGCENFEIAHFWCKSDFAEGWLPSSDRVDLVKIVLAGLTLR